MKKFLFVFLAGTLWLGGWSTRAFNNFDRIPAQVWAAEVSGETADGEMADAEEISESETETETEFLPVLLDTDKVSTDDFLLYASGALVMDVDTGAILYHKNKLERFYPASTTKIMTALLALENCTLDENVTFSENAVYSITWDSSNMALEPGDSLTMEEALYGIMLSSANEAANGVAEYVSGSMEAFAQEMTDYAISLGCRRTNFTNPSGLHDDNHYTTAKDLAIIASAALKNEDFARIAGSALYTIENVNYEIEVPEPETDEDGNPVEPENETEVGQTVSVEAPRAKPVTLYNHHKMVVHTYPYDDCIGGKTGYTEEARNTLVTYAQRDGHRLVCVILDGPGGGNFIYMDTETALNYCFENYDRLADVYAQSQALLDYEPMSVIDWYEPEPPMTMEEMFYPYLKQVYGIYGEYMVNRKAQEALDKAIAEKSVESFIEYSKYHQYKPLIIAAGILIAVMIVLIIVVIWSLRILRRQGSRMRYKKLKRLRKEADLQQAVESALAQQPEDLQQTADVNEESAAAKNPEIDAPNSGTDVKIEDD